MELEIIMLSEISSTQIPYVFSNVQILVTEIPSVSLSCCLGHQESPWVTVLLVLAVLLQLS